MKKVLLGLVVLLAACVRFHGGIPAPEVVRGEILEMLARGAANWNRGDLDGFVADYTDDATFVTPRSVVHGRAEIRARYAPRFALGAQRDSLHFENLEIDVVGPHTVNAIAYYVLTRGDSTTARGPTSLILKKIEGRWMIVHDHSS